MVVAANIFFAVMKNREENKEITHVLFFQVLDITLNSERIKKLTPTAYKAPSDFTF